ncbi:hypothetical protein EYF80_028953 [Liparis tanakae]|uniref:Uncharacterized protein n=1 Tax=Liparis tanakae TaxID=230148 RepID=A0A4Z2H6Y3_9TELE|nr:hypothetical protein EYF80_028953 [Liparis tanakae]
MPATQRLHQWVTGDGACDMLDRTSVEELWTGVEVRRASCVSPIRVRPRRHSATGASVGLRVCAGSLTSLLRTVLGWEAPAFLRLL